ncbi:hypothetical protein BH09BAC5_BH09BAC5_11550 [soil metagenome]
MEALLNKKNLYNSISNYVIGYCPLYYFQAVSLFHKF